MNKIINQHKEVKWDNCPHCGCPVKHESTKLQEAVMCTLCPARMITTGSSAMLNAMWNARVK